MVLQLENMPKVEALRTYPAGTLDRLAQLLAMGVSAKADPRRECFYEVESDSEVFYVHRFSCEWTCAADWNLAGNLRFPP